MLKPGEAGVLPRAARAAAVLERDGRRYLRKSKIQLASKRAFDIVVAGLGLLVALPLFAAIAVLIKLDSKGPVFFRQGRVGRHRRPFRMWKFRKMYDDLPSQGPSLTLRYDFRMTRVGRLLERTKLDELPQLINVLTGDMSVIGPRPEVPKFVEHYPEQWGDVLSVKPGIFGLNQIRNRNESELYPPGVSDVEGFYVSHILPDKLKIDAEYARQGSFLEDCWILVKCFLAATLGVVTWRTVMTMRQQVLNLAVLSGAGIGGMVAAHVVAGRSLREPVAIHALWLAAILKPAILILFRIPKSLAISMTADDLLRVLRCMLVVSLALVLGMHAWGHRELDGLVLALDGAIFLGALLLHKLALYGIHLSFRAQRGRALVRRLVAAGVIAAPVSLLVAATVARDPAVSGPIHPALLLIAALIRPTLLLFIPARRSQQSRFAWMMALQRHLAMATLAGSGMIGLAVAMADGSGLGAVAIMIDAVVFHLAMTGFAVWQTGRLAKGGSGANAPPVERVLVAGSGIELGAYVSALAAIPEARYQMVGVLTPHDGDRTSMIGGYPVLGELADLGPILKTMRIDRVVVVPNGLPRASMSVMQRAAAESGCRYAVVPLLSAIVARSMAEARASRSAPAPDKTLVLAPAPTANGRPS